MAHDLFPLPPTPQPPLSPSGGAAKFSVNGKRIGRPPGAANKGSLQLAKYIEATFGGMTPGQQSAQLGMVTPKDLRTAKAQAAELGFPADLVKQMPELELAMVVKTARLARALGCDRRDAWLLLQRERAELLAFVHQKQPPAKDTAGAPPPTVYLVPEAEASALPPPDPDDVDDEAIEILNLSEGG